jgi:hypothetical protein
MIFSRVRAVDSWMPSRSAASASGTPLMIASASRCSAGVRPYCCASQPTGVRCT